MNGKILTGVAGIALACASGWAAAQGTPSGTTGGSGSAATSSDQGASAGQRSTSKRQHGAKAGNGSNATSNGPVAAPSGGIAHPKDVTPGTYNSSGNAVPTTSDPAQTKNAKDGSPLPRASARGSTAASGAGK